MRFFSNDSKESSDRDATPDDARNAAEAEYGRHENDTDRVTSDPVAVPQQRSGSPWSDAPTPADGTPAASGYDPLDAPPPFPADSSSSSSSSDSPSDSPRGDSVAAVPATDAVFSSDPATHPDPVVHTDSSSVHTDSSAHADSSPDAVFSTHGEPDSRPDEVDLPLDDTDADRSTATATTYSPDGSVTTEPITGTSGGTFADDRADDAALKDDGGFDDPKAVDPDTDKPLDHDASADDTVTDRDTTDVTDDRTEDAALKDDGGFDDPKAVDPDTDKPLDRDAATTGSINNVSADTGTGLTGSPAPGPEVIAVPVPFGATATTPVTTAAGSATTTPTDSTTDSDSPVAAAASSDGNTADGKPGSVTEPTVDTIFAASDSKSFQDRWREVQLRFVDSPREATDEAASLVSEAVDKLTEALRSQQAAVSENSSDDTERLRVELRGYRDMLNRILAL